MKTKTIRIITLVLIAFGSIGCSSSQNLVLGKANATHQSNLSNKTTESNKPVRVERYSDYDVTLTPLYLMVDVYKMHEDLREFFMIMTDN